MGGGMYAANSVLLLMLVSRKLGVDTSGVFSIAFTVSQIVWIIGVFGTSHMMMTDYLEEFKFSSYFTVKIFTSILMLIISAAICMLMKFEREKTLLTLLLTLYMLAHSISELYQSRMFQKNRLDLSGKSQFFRTLFSLLCFALALYSTDSLIIAAISLTLGNFFSIWAFSYIPCRKFIPKKEKTSMPEKLLLIKACFPVFISILLMNMLMQMPKFTIELVGNDSMQGIFSMIFMPAYAINLVSNFVYQPMLKKLGDCIHGGDKKGIYGHIKKLSLFTLAATAFCSLLAWLIGIPILSWLYGVDLDAHKLSLAFVVMGGGIYALCQLMYYTVMLFRNQKLTMLNYMVCFVLSVPLCYFLVCRAGLFGAVLSFIFTHLLLLALFTLIFHFLLRRIADA